LIDVDYGNVLEGSRGYSGIEIQQNRKW